LSQSEGEVNHSEMLDFLKSIPAVAVFYVGLWMAGLTLIRIIWVTRREAAITTNVRERADANLRATFALIGLMVVFTVALATTFLATGRQLSPPPTETTAPSRAVTTVVSRSISPSPPPTLAFTPTSTNTPAAILSPAPLPTPTPVGTPTPQPTPTVAVEVQPSPTPELSQDLPPNCADLGVRITEPSPGAHLTGIATITGSATVENFDYYKLELRSPGEEWVYLLHSTQAVIEGVLGQWDTVIVGPGEYELRLVVVDVTGNYPEPCAIQLVVD
jgi:hypothetical protein